MRLKNTKSYLSIPTLIARNFIFDPKIDDMYKCLFLSCNAFEINAALFLLTMTTLGCWVFYWDEVSLQCSLTNPFVSSADPPLTTLYSPNACWDNSNRWHLKYSEQNLGPKIILKHSKRACTGNCIGRNCIFCLWQITLDYIERCRRAC